MRAEARKFVFVATAVLLLVVVFVLMTDERAAERSPRARARAADGAVAIQTRAPPVVPRDATEAHRDPQQHRRLPQSTPRAGTGERERTTAPPVIRRDARAATAAARAFLRGYLGYSYGHATASDLRAASVALVRALMAAPPRVPATVAKADPRLVSVRAQATTGDHEVAVAGVVEDGQRRYEIPLTLRRAGNRWIVIAVSG